MHSIAWSSYAIRRRRRRQRRRIDVVDMAIGTEQGTAAANGRSVEG